MRFTSAPFLLLLLILPYFVWLAWPRHGGRRHTRWWAGLILRLLIATLIILSLAGIQMVRAADELAVVFLVDGSDSVTPAEREAAEAYVRQAIAELPPGDRAAVIVFAANALVERPMSGVTELAPLSSVPQSLHTDLGEAIRLGLALFPAGSARRMVILSDGAATVGKPLQAARLAASAGVQIDYVPMTRGLTSEEARVVGVDAPTRVVRGDNFAVEVRVSSTANMPATLRLLDASGVVHEASVQLRPGSNNFTIPLRAGQQEFARYMVELAPGQDAYYQNNRLAAFTEIVGPPRILMVAGGGAAGEGDAADQDEATQLQAALRSAGLQVDRVTPSQIPGTLSRLSNYASLILVNVNGKEIHPRLMSLLQSYVRDLGGGLVAVGGPQSYGMGGYYGTPLEETLPVEMQIKDQERFPAVSMAIVIDRSGSMAVPEGSLTKIQLADEAAVRVVELLNEFDEITVIPVDTQPSGVIGPAAASDKGPIIDEIRQIGAGGGGINVRTGLEAAAEAVAQSSNEIKHIIILADGNDSNEQDGVPQLIEEVVAEGITVSMVAIGEGKDVPWLQRMAELGQGRFHLTLEAANLPQIFTQETASIQRSYLVEERFFPTLVTRSPILGGIRQVPPLYGYVGTSPKSAAQVVLETHLGDPLLAAWQYGLGRSVAWTSDASGRWAREWVPWEGFPTFWAQATRWTIVQNRQSNVETAVVADGQRSRLIVDARGADEQYLNNLDMSANVVGPEGDVAEIELDQVAPGRYEGTFRPDAEGAYLLRVSGSGEAEAGDVSVAQTTGWVLGYSPEYGQSEGGEQLLQSIAELTGGRDVSEDPQAVLAHTLEAGATTRPIWPWLTLLAVLLLPVDVAVRRLSLSRRDVQRAWAALRGRVRPARPRPQREEQVARLFQAKERAQRASEPAQPGIEARPAPEAPAGEAAPEPPVEERTQPEKPPEERAAEEADEDSSLAARLLARRQQDQSTGENS